ncbi:hypothetical protein [Skermania piniformis]|uniref:Uncharacterized protein n=1 Tax=Skermania pinensis TaxID=39122 RepID=A0ABX8S8S2_9ACTN|nr:hypothetical protein [Skermania piniformis]QXQ14234.1 hypothetical protein KV203_02015 [Skermania piniformis]
MTDPLAPLQYGSPPPPPPLGKSNAPLIIGIVVGALVLVTGGFVAGRMSVDGASGLTGPFQRADSGVVTAELPTMEVEPVQDGIVVTDSGSDAAPHAVDGKVYGPGDIVGLAVRTDGASLVLTTEYSRSTPMDLLSGATRIRVDTGRAPTCKDSVLDSFDWSIDYDTDGVTVYRPGAGCDDEFQQTSIAGVADISGSTLTVEVDLDSLGIRSGQEVVVRACISTRIDSSSTTFIQDWAPDTANGATGSL